MEYIKREIEDGLLIMTMSRSRANALNRDMVEQMCSVLDEAAADEKIRALVIASDQPRFFSAGFDLKEVFDYDRAQMTEFFGRFIDLYQGLNHLPLPVVAAVSGHAFAGGAVLALAADVRILADGDYGFALNEIKLGLVLPPRMMSMLLNATGPGPARWILLSGDALSPSEALSTRVANELAPPDSVLERAKATARLLSERPPSAFAAFKQALAGAAGHAELDDHRYLSEFIDRWFSDEAEERKRATAETLKR